ncbi:MAG: hypothetical protein IKS45_12395, partial [Thermoguttaceae bacterium]|nr:hypothetical protein [Thermoguttaceae bacterium]
MVRTQSVPLTNHLPLTTYHWLVHTVTINNHNFHSPILQKGVIMAKKASKDAQNKAIESFINSRPGLKDTLS